MKWYLTFALLLLAIPFTFACNCNGVANWGDLKNRVDNVAGAALTATVSKIKKADNYLEVTYKVGEVFKGGIKKKTIKVRYDLGTSCAVQEKWFEVGQEKLITAYQSKGSNTWEANNCDAFITNDNKNARRFNGYVTHLRKMDNATVER